VRHDQPRPACRRCGRPKPEGQGRKLCDACTTYAPKDRPPPGNRCNACHDPIAPRKQLCDSCRELARWKTLKRARLRSRKPCRGCGGPKGPGHRRRYCDRCLKKRAAMPVCVACRERPRRYRTARLCEPCLLEAKARERERHRRWNRAHRAKRAEQRSRRNAATREASRMTRRLRAEREGNPYAPVPESTYLRLYGSGRGVLQPRVDPAPLIPRLDPFSEDLEAFAESVGLSGSYLRRVVNGRYEKGISILDADRICMGLGVPFELVYSEAA
jgi:hypothetical protein